MFPVGPCLCLPIIISAKMNEVSNLAEIIIGKQRHGPTGNIMLEFEAMFTKFKDTQIS